MNLYFSLNSFLLAIINSNKSGSIKFNDFINKSIPFLLSVALPNTPKKFLFFYFFNLNFNTELNFFLDKKHFDLQDKEYLSI